VLPGLALAVGATVALGGAVVGTVVAVRVDVGAAVVGAAVVDATVGEGVTRAVSGVQASPATNVSVNSPMSTRFLAIICPTV
jgi:hypothetical protein